MNRNSFNFGEGSFIGLVMSDPTFFEQPPRDQARAMGWVAGCPVVEQLTDPSNPDPNRGPDVMIGRYAQVNFWFGYVASEVEKINPDLHAQLITAVPRRADEPLGVHEPISVPSEYFNEMAPMATLAGYALPRLFMDQIAGSSPEESRTKLGKAQKVLEDAAVKATTPAELLAIMAEDALMEDESEDDAAVEAKVLARVLPVGWFNEHNAVSMVEEMKEAMQDHAPMLWDAYKQLPPSKKTAAKII